MKLYALLKGSRGSESYAIIRYTAGYLEKALVNTLQQYGYVPRLSEFDVWGDYGEDPSPPKLSIKSQSDVRARIGESSHPVHVRLSYYRKIFVPERFIRNVPEGFEFYSSAADISDLDSLIAETVLDRERLYLAEDLNKVYTPFFHMNQLSVNDSSLKNLRWLGPPKGHVCTDGKSFQEFIESIRPWNPKYDGKIKPEMWVEVQDPRLHSYLDLDPKKLVHDIFQNILHVQRSTDA